MRERKTDFGLKYLNKGGYAVKPVLQTKLWDVLAFPWKPLKTGLILKQSDKFSLL